MRVFLDCEFTSFVRLELISIGLVCVDGREFYARRAGYVRDDCSEFVRSVLSILGRASPALCDRAELALRLNAWFDQFEGPVTIVCDSEEDWVLLGTTLAQAGKIHSNVSERLILRNQILQDVVFIEAMNHSYSLELPAHHAHALADARALRAGYETWCAKRDSRDGP